MQRSNRMVVGGAVIALTFLAAIMGYARYLQVQGYAASCHLVGENAQNGWSISEIYDGTPPP